MRRFFNILIIALVSINASCTKIQDNLQKSQLSYYPESSWEEYVSPQQVGFDIEKLQKAKTFYDSLNASSVLVLYKGKILLNWGDNTRRFRSTSVRKSFLNALYGIAYDNKILSLNDKLNKFNISEFKELTDTERAAEIKDLLSSSSGVYLPAAYESEVWTKRKPKRGLNKPGEIWYYNNWDFNTLGLLYNKITNSKIEVDFQEKIANKIGMQDFRPDLDFKYFFERDISIPAYLFKTSARDMARFGLLYLRNGVWKDKQIISKEWIELSTKKIKEPWDNTGYGYLWWNTKIDNGDQIYYANGAGVQGIYVIPDKDLVMIFRSDTYLGPEVKDGLEINLLNKIVNAKVSEPEKTIETRGVTWNKYYSSNYDANKFKNWEGDYKNNILKTLSVSLKDNNLMLNTKIADFVMYPISENSCWIEDLNITAEFKSSETKKHTSLLTKDKLILFN